MAYLSRLETFLPDIKPLLVVLLVLLFHHARAPVALDDTRQTVGAYSVATAAVYGAGYLANAAVRTEQQMLRKSSAKPGDMHWS